MRHGSARLSPSAPLAPAPIRHTRRRMGARSARGGSRYDPPIIDLLDALMGARCHHATGSVIRASCSHAKHEASEWALCLLRLSVFLVMLMWALDKFPRPEHAVGFFAHFYALGGLGRWVFYVLGGLELSPLAGLRHWRCTTLHVWCGAASACGVDILRLAPVPASPRRRQPAVLHGMAHASGLCGALPAARQRCLHVRRRPP